MQPFLTSLADGFLFHDDQDRLALYQLPHTGGGRTQIERSVEHKVWQEEHQHRTSRILLTTLLADTRS
jgi:hypothetical protein